jgi:hypothetical protein
LDEIAVSIHPRAALILFDRPELEPSAHFSEAVRNHGSRAIN